MNKSFEGFKRKKHYGFPKINFRPEQEDYVSQSISTQLLSDES